MRGARGKGPLEKGYYEVVGSEGGGEGYSLTLRMPRRGLPLPLPPSLPLPLPLLHAPYLASLLKDKL